MFLISYALSGQAKEIHFKKVLKVNILDATENRDADLHFGVFYTNQDCVLPIWNRKGTALAFYLSVLRDKKVVVCKVIPNRSNVKVSDVSRLSFPVVKQVQQPVSQKLPDFLSTKARVFSWASNGHDFLVQGFDNQSGSYKLFRGNLGSMKPYLIQNIPSGTIDQIQWIDNDKAFLFNVNGVLHKASWKDIFSVKVKPLFIKKDVSHYFFACPYAGSPLVVEQRDTQGNQGLYWTLRIKGPLSSLVDWRASAEMFPSFFPNGHILGFLSRGTPTKTSIEPEERESQPLKIYLRNFRNEKWGKIIEATKGHSPLSPNYNPERFELCWAGEKTVLFLTQDPSQGGQPFYIRGLTLKNKGNQSFSIKIPRKFQVEMSPPITKDNNKFIEYLNGIYDLAAIGNKVAFTGINGRSGKKRLYIGVLQDGWEDI